jgi:hypothetical protein
MVVTHVGYWDNILYSTIDAIARTKTKEVASRTKGKKKRPSR